MHVALSLPQINDDVARRVSLIVKRHAGIDVPPGKTDMLRNRLAPRLRALALPDFVVYAAFLDGPRGPEELPRLIEAITTHTTSFYREDRQFTWLAAEGLPALLAEGEREIGVWSAACSTGAELYTAAMVVEDFGRRRMRPLHYRCIGTDISRQILARAEAAVYTAEEIDGIPEALRRLHLLRSRAGRGGANGAPLYSIHPEMRARARFLQANLLQLARTPRFEVDVAFLRNVLIYFDRFDQARVVAAVAARIRPGGYLLTGHSEALFEPPTGLASVASSIYRKAP